MKRPRFKKNKKCSKTGKAKFHTEQDAGRAMMRIWSHDTSADIYDLHVYPCPYATPNDKHFHIGHISYYQKELEKTNGNHTHTATEV